MNLITTPATVYTPPETSIVHETTASLTDRRQIMPIHLMQYDQTMPVIAVALTANGQPYTVPSGAAVNVRMDKPDGRHVYDPALGLSDDRQTAYIGITAQMTAAAGRSGPIVEIVVDGGVVGTAAFPVIIDKNPVPDSAIESSDEWLTIEQILQQVEEAADVVQQNAQNLQNLTDNLEAVQNAAGNAQAAAASAAAAQQAAQEALGFRTFFSAITPDSNGDLDPSRPMTTPTAASVTVKSKGDRIQSVQVNGFTTQAGSGDASPNNVRDISTAGLRMVKLVLTGTENWVQAPSMSGADPAFVSNVIQPPASGVSEDSAAKSQFCTDCPIKNADGYSGACVWVYGTGTVSGVRVRLFGAKSVGQFKSALASRYASGNPVIIWYVPSDESQATGLYIPVETQGHEYRCQCLELTAPLCDGDKVESCVPSGFDKKLTLDSSTENIEWNTMYQTLYITLPIPVLAHKLGMVLSDKWITVTTTYVFPGKWTIPAVSTSSDLNKISFSLPGVDSVESYRQYMQENGPAEIYYKSAAYTEANDIPVQLETHAQSHLIVDGTDYVGAAGVVDETGFYCYLINKALDTVPSYNNDAVCSHFKNAKSQLGYGFAENQLNSFCVANNQYGLRFAISHEVLGTTPQTSVADCSAAVKAYFAAQYAAGTPITIVYPLSTSAVYVHDPVTLAAVPYTQADVDAANQRANTPSTLPAIDSPDVPMLLDETGDAEPAAQVMALAANAVPVAGTYVVSSQDGTTLAVSLKAMQDGGDAATLGGMTLDDIKQLISDAVSAAINQ